jgi:hypothetical protein
MALYPIIINDNIGLKKESIDSYMNDREYSL